MMLWICFLVMLWSPGPRWAAATECKVSSYGKSFIFGFVDLPFYSSRFSVTDPQISVQLITQAFANVSITVPSSSSTRKTLNTVTSTYYVNKTQVVPFNSSLINKYQDTSSGGVIKITSDVPVAVLMVYKNGVTYTTCPVLSSSAMSTSYVIPSYDVSDSSNSQAQLFVTALNDSTTVKFDGFETGSVEQPLNQNEIFMYQRNVDLSGTIVTSNNPVVIISSVTVGNLIMQAPPVDTNALHFIIPSLRYHHNDRIIRIYAPFKSANLEIHSTSLHIHTKYVTVYPKIFYEIKADYKSVLEIVSDSPVVVAHITTGGQLMTNIPAVSQFLNTYPVDIGYQPSPFASFTITIQYNKASGLLVDGKPIIHNPDQTAKSTPLGNYTVLTIGPMAVPVTVSHIASEPFGLFYEGQDYFYPAGMQFTRSDCSSANPSTDPSGGFIG